MKPMDNCAKDTAPEELYWFINNIQRSPVKPPIDELRER